MALDPPQGVGGKRVDARRERRPQPDRARPAGFVLYLWGRAVNITAPGGDCPPAGDCDGRYFILNDGISASGAPNYYLAAGTSMATPHVSAVAAYVRAIHPDWTPGKVRAWLQSTAEAIGNRQFFGHGMLDANAAVR